MKNLNQIVILFLISLSTSAQVSNKILTNNPNQQKGKTSNNLRTTSGNKQQLDSLVSPTIKFIYTYDAAGNSILEIGYSRASVSESWNIYRRNEYAYGAAGNMILNLGYAWNDLRKVFVKNYKYEWFYDVNKNMTSEIIYDWDIDNAIWVEKYKSENTFGSNGQINKTDSYYWDGSVWADNGYTEYTYNSKDLLLEEVKYLSFNHLSYTTTYTYNTDDNVSSKTIANYGGNPNMYSGSKYAYTYDAANNITLLLHSEWNIGIEDWENTNKSEYEFDVQNNNTKQITFHWDNNTEAWVPSYKFSYTYDNTYSITDLTLPTEFNQSLKHKLTSKVYNVLSIGWEAEAKYILYYQDRDEITTRIDYAVSNALTVYPNPANDRVFFANKTSETATLELFNELGELVVNNAIVMNQPVSVEGLSKGIYFYRISNTNAGIYSGTLIKN